METRKIGMETGLEQILELEYIDLKKKYVYLILFLFTTASNRIIY